MQTINEIGRIIISMILLVIASFLFWCSLKSTTDIGSSKAMGDIASAIISAILVYWLAPRIPYNGNKKGTRDE